VFLEKHGHRTQHAIADLVTVDVFETLEMVEVQEHNNKRMLLPLGS
jgi:hypothetical protein